MSDSKPKLKVRTLDEMFKKISESTEEKFEDTKGAIRNRRRTYNTMAKKVQTDKQRSTKHAYTYKDRVTRTPLKTVGELRCSGG
jgi:ribosome recycling factor